MPRYFKTNIEKEKKETKLNFSLEKSILYRSKNWKKKNIPSYPRFLGHIVYQYIDKFSDAAVTCALVTIPIYHSLKRIKGEITIILLLFLRHTVNAVKLCDSVSTEINNLYHAPRI